MIRPFVALVLADLFDRTRRASFLFALAPAAYLGYTVYAGFWSMRHGDFRAEPSAAYVGAMMALLTGMLLALFGFYLVKNAVARDRQTGVGQILAATPLSRPLYTLSKATSNLLVLVAMVVVLALAACLVAASAAGARIVADLLLPFVLLALPLMALTAAAAVLFETIPLLHAGLGNVVWLFVWAGLPVVAIQTDAPLLDPTGLTVVRSSLLAAQHAAYPQEATEVMSLSAGPLPAELRTFPWDGVDWALPSVAARLWWIALAVLVALAAALPFDRFDPARERRGRRTGGRARAPARRDRAAASRLESVPGTGGVAAARPAPSAFELLRAPAGQCGWVVQAGRLFVTELRLLLIGQPTPWYLGALALLVAQTAVPLGPMTRHLLPFAWIWPIVVWSRLGCWSRLQGTEPLLNAAPRPLLRQLPMSWAAGVAIALALTAPAALRLLWYGDSAWIGPIAATVFVPSLALALGSVSGTSRLFEVVYLILWYVGPLSGVAALDFLGGAGQDGGASVPLLFAASALPLLLAAAASRSRRLKR